MFHQPPHEGAQRTRRDSNVIRLAVRASLFVGLAVSGVTIGGCSSVTRPRDVLRECMRELHTETPVTAAVYVQEGTQNPALENLHEITLAGPYAWRGAGRDSTSAWQDLHSPLRNVRVHLARRGVAWMISSIETTAPDSVTNEGFRRDPVMNCPAGAVAVYFRASYGDACEWKLTELTRTDDSTYVVAATVPAYSASEFRFFVSLTEGEWKPFPMRAIGQ